MIGVDLLHVLEELFEATGGKDIEHPGWLRFGVVPGEGAPLRNMKDGAGFGFDEARLELKVDVALEDVDRMRFSGMPMRDFRGHEIRGDIVFQEGETPACGNGV